MTESSRDASSRAESREESRADASKRAGAGKGARAEIALGVPSWILLGLLALTPAVFATGFSNYEFVKELVFLGGVGLALMVWGVESVRARAVSMAAGRVTVLVLIFGLYAFAASLWSDNLLLGLWDSLQFVALAAVFLIISAPVGRPISFYDFSVATAVGAALAGLFGVLDLAGVGLFTMVWDPPGATGAFDAMEFGVAYYVVALPVLLAATFRFTDKSRFLFAACFALAGFHFALVSGWTWAAIFAGVCALTVLAVVAFQRSQSMLVLIPVLVLLGAVAVFLAVAQWGLAAPAQTSEATNLPRLQQGSLVETGRDGRIQNTMFADGRTESVTDMRAHSYLVAVGSDLFAEQPIVGHGAGSWWTLQTKAPNIDHPYVAAMFEYYPAFKSAHSGVTKLLVEYGLVGLVLFALWIIAVFAVSFGALGGRTESAMWILEHWALLTAGLAGLVFLVFTPLLELAPAALAWVGAMAVLTRFSASLNDFRGWSNVWTARFPEQGSPINRVTAGAALAGLVGLGILVPTVLNAAAGYYRGQGDQYMLRTMYEEAIDAYEQVGRWYPADGEVAYNISLAHSRMSQLSEEREVVELAARQRPYDVRALILYGRTLMGGPDDSDAVRIGRRAVDAYPNSIRARELLIAALDIQERYEDAVNEALALLERNPPAEQRVRLHMIAGDLYNDMLERYSDAVSHYQKAQRLMTSPQQRARLQEKIQGLERTIENERRMREGKPPLPERAPDHNHGPGPQMPH